MRRKRQLDERAAARFMSDDLADLLPKLVVLYSFVKTIQSKINAELLRRSLFLREKTHRTVIIPHKDRTKKCSRAMAGPLTDRGSLCAIAFPSMLSIFLWYYHFDFFAGFVL